MSAVLYEVTLDVEVAIAEEFRAWLDAHVRAMLALPGFVGASVSGISEPAAEPGRVVFCCLYRLRDAAALDAYLAEHAPRMRADGQAHFGSRFSARRRVLTVLAEY